MTRLGDFWKFLVTNFLTKVAQMYVDFLGYFENFQFHFLTTVVTFWATLGLLNISASGHTGVTRVHFIDGRVNEWVDSHRWLKVTFLMTEKSFFPPSLARAIKKKKNIDDVNRNFSTKASLWDAVLMSDMDKCYLSSTYSRLRRVRKDFMPNSGWQLGSFWKH